VPPPKRSGHFLPGGVHKNMRIPTLVAALVVAAPLFLSVDAAQQAPAGAQDARLPVKRVVLYKSGIGYFEHLGRVRGQQDVTIEFTSGQLDDVLKSLTALDLDGGRVSSVSYNSDAGITRRLSGLRLPLGPSATRSELLTSLRGARVSIRGAAVPLTGRLLSVERQERRVGDVATPVDILSLVTDAGDLHTVALDTGITVRILDADLNAEVAKYLAVIGSSRDEDVRLLTLSTDGAGDRELFVSYVSEVPVWKSTYRLVLGAGGTAPLLQGWAIVDNTIGEDWDNVELSLVAGAPQAFIQRLSQPYYVQRPVVALPERMLSTPQTHSGAVRGGVVGGIPAPAPPPPPAATPEPPAPLAGRLVGGRGGGAGNMTVDALRPLEERVQAAQTAMQAMAAGSDLGDLFEYKLKTPVTIRKNQSAMVPILSGTVTAEKVSIWSAGSGNPRPLRAVWITNSTGQILDGGSMSIVEGQAFAGEGLIDPVKAGERRLVSYATDLAMLVTSTGDTSPSRITRVQMTRGVLIQHREDRQRRVYSARNEDAQPRVLVIEHPVRDGWVPGGTLKADETTPTAHRFRVTVAPRETATITVEEVRPGQTSYAINAVSTDQIQLWVSGEAITADAAATLRDVVRRRTVIAELNTQIAARDGEITAIGRDQERVRENMKALRGSAEERQLVQRYVQQLDDQENQLATHRRALADLMAKRAAAQADLDRFIASLSGPA
jgi:hypothetical protein